MTEFSISGYEILAGTRILIPVDIASIQPGIIIPITGTVNVGSVNAVIDVATLNAVIDVATIQTVGTVGIITTLATIENAPLVTIQGTITASVASLVTIGTIENAPLVTVQGTLSASLEYAVTVGTIDNAPLVTVQGAVSASVEYPVTVAGTVDVATLLNQPGVTDFNAYKQTNILTNQTVIAGGSSTLTAQALQDAVVDVVYGTVVAGSIQTAVIGVDPQSGVQTGTITAGSWFAGTQQTGQRLVAAGPLGGEIAVAWDAPSASILNVYITAEQSTGS